MRITFQSRQTPGSGHCDITSTLSQDQAKDRKTLAWPIKVRPARGTSGDYLVVSGIRPVADWVRWPGAVKDKVSISPRLARR